YAVAHDALAPILNSNWGVNGLAVGKAGLTFCFVGVAKYFWDGTLKFDAAEVPRVKPFAPLRDPAAAEVKVKAKRWGKFESGQT
ncbi:MAG: hypothetical protein P4L87_10410, partial [Formivibrio sp.]|nr:hypothetical protein [Formivibrio sp.]